MLDPWKLVTDSVELDEGIWDIPETILPELPTLKSEKMIRNLIPLDVVLLGVDPSKNSTGVFLWSTEGAWSEKLPTIPSYSGEYAEVLSRRKLGEYLLNFLEGKPQPTHVVIEDAFISGKHLSSARILGALNTALDEVLLDTGLCDKVRYYRIPSPSWKAKWIDYSGLTYLNLISDPKKKVVEFLESVIWDGDMSCEDYLFTLNPDRKGIQDRRDAFACAVSIFIPSEKGERKVKQSEVVIKANPDIDVLLRMLPDRELIESPITQLSKPRITTLLSQYPDNVFCTSIPVSVGVLIDVPDKWKGEPLYVAYWRKR